MKNADTSSLDSPRPAPRPPAAVSSRSAWPPVRRPPRHRAGASARRSRRRPAGRPSAAGLGGASARPRHRHAPSATPSMDHSPAPSAAPSAPAVDHDADALAVVERFLGGEGASMTGTGNQPLEPHARRRGQGLRADDRGDGPPDRRREAAGPGSRLQRHVARAAAHRRRGRPRPGDLHQQHERVDRHPLPRPVGARTTWTASRTSPRTRSLPVASFTYEFVAKPRRLAYVPQPPQRDRPGRPRAARRVHRRAARPGPALRRAVRGEPGHHLDQQRRARRLHDQRPRLPGDVTDRRDTSATRSSSGS